MHTRSTGTEIRDVHQAEPGGTDINGDVGHMTTFDATVLRSIAATDPMTETHGKAAITSPSAATAGWFDDPEGRHHLRYFDGDVWTQHVTHFGPSPCVACRSTAG